MNSVLLTELGIAVFDGKKLLRAFPFSNPSEDYVFVKRTESRLSDLIKFLSGSQIGFSVNDGSLLAILKKKSIDVQLMSETEISNIQSSKPKILIDAGFAKDENDALARLRDFAIQLSSSKVSEVSQSPDLHITQAINTLDETDKIVNGISSRLREWYGLHFPELDNIIDSIIGYSQIVLAGKRENLSKEIYEQAGFPDSKVEMLTLVAEKSRGGDISSENLAIVQTLAKQILNFSELRKDLEKHIELQMKNVAPNLTAILGPAVGARILARTGSLKNLASKPASTIQVLGAEKALFRSLKTGSQPPKHGLLFQHALVHAAPRWQRGKIARAIAAKAAIAARVDQYGEGLNQVLLEKLNIRVNEISKKYKEPPEKNFQPKQFFEKNKPKLNSKRGKNKKRNRFGRR